MDKKSTLKDKILQFIEYQGIKKQEFFEITGIASSNFKGANINSELGGEKLVKILTTYPELSADWLLRNEGEMLRSSDFDAQTEKINNQIALLDKQKNLTGEGKESLSIENKFQVILLGQQLQERDFKILQKKYNDMDNEMKELKNMLSQILENVLS